MSELLLGRVVPASGASTSVGVRAAPSAHVPHAHTWAETNWCLVLRGGRIDDTNALKPLEYCSGCGLIRFAGFEKPVASMVDETNFKPDLGADMPRFK